MSKLPLIPIDEFIDERNGETIAEYEAAMKQRNDTDLKTPNVVFYPGFAFVEKRPIDCEIADGKKQRVFYNRNEMYGLQAAAKSAQAQLLRMQKPINTREFPEDPIYTSTSAMNGKKSPPLSSQIL